jgi:hypothetical protein
MVNPKDSMDVTRASILPLKPIPEIVVLQERPQDVFTEQIETQIKPICNDVRVILDVLPHYLLTLHIASSPILVISRHVTVEIVPLHVGATKRDKHRRGRMEELGLGN